MREELRVLTRLGLPVVGSQLGMMLLHAVDTLMLGRFSVDALAAAALGTQWIFLTVSMGMGLVMGIDPLVAQQHGAGSARGVSRALLQGLTLAASATILISIAWLFTEEVLLAAQQDPNLAKQAHRYVVLQLPSVFPFLAWTALRSYLQGREIVLPAMWVMVPVNLANVFFNWLFIFGPGPFPEWGLDGAAQATNLSRILTGALLLAWTWYGKLHHGGWEPPRWREVFAWASFKEPLILGLPIAIQTGLEVLAWAITALIVGTISPVALAAHSIVLSFAALLFMVPLGISFGATTRVGNLIGATKGDQTTGDSPLSRAFRAIVALGAAAITFNVSVLVLGRNVIASAYTDHVTVVFLGAEALIVCAAFQISDCAQVIASGTLRGMGRTKAPAVATFVGYYIFGIPWGYYFGITLDHGLKGLWWGLALGLTGVAVGLVGWLFRVRNRPLRTAGAST